VIQVCQTGNPAPALTRELLLINPLRITICGSFSPRNNGVGKGPH
jgi:hypothetical protein